MRVRLSLAALAVVASTAVGGAAPAHAAPVITARVCTTQNAWTFSPALGVGFNLGGSAVDSYTASCSVQAGLDTAAPYVVTSSRPPYSAALGYTYYGGCHVAALLRSGGTGGAVIVGGVVGVLYGASVGTFNTVSVQALIPSPGVCNESSASGLGVAVGTF